MAKNSNPSLLDPGQIIKRAFNDDSDSFRVDAEVVANISGAQEVIISDTDDSIKIGDGSGNFVSVTDNRLDVNAAFTGSTDVNLQGLNSFKVSRYTVGTSPVQITTSPLTGRSCVSIKLIATAPTEIVYIGPTALTAQNDGYPLFNGDTAQLDLKDSQQIWLVATSAAQRIYVMELGG